MEREEWSEEEEVGEECEEGRGRCSGLPEEVTEDVTDEYEDEH